MKTKTMRVALAIELQVPVEMTAGDLRRKVEMLLEHGSIRESFSLIDLPMEGHAVQDVSDLAVRAEDDRCPICRQEMHPKHFHPHDYSGDGPICLLCNESLEAHRNRSPQVCPKCCDAAIRAGTALPGDVCPGCLGKVA